MPKYNVKMWIALDKDKNDILIDDAIPCVDYYCYSCGKIVRSRAKSSDLVTEHFYHLEKCECNGESTIHKYWKENLINIGETIILPEVGEINCIDKRVEFRFNTKHGIYIPDLIIKTNNPKYQFIIFEIYNTNAKKIDEYSDMWKELKYNVFEIDVSNLKRDKSNFDKNAKIIYSQKRYMFVIESKSSIRKLYNLIENGSYCTDYFEIKPILNKFYRIFKNNLTKPVRTNLRLLEKELTITWWQGITYVQFVIPLTKILNDLKKYA